MCVSSSVLPSDEIQDIIFSEPFSNPQAAHLDSLPGMHHKAFNCNDCGQVAFTLRDAEGHEWRQVFHCNLRYCPTCAAYHVSEKLERNIATLRVGIRENPDVQSFRRVRIWRTYSQDLTPADIQSFKEDISAGVDSVASPGTFGQVYPWPEKRMVEARIFLLGEYDISILLAAFPNTIIRAITLPIGRAEETLREVISPDLPHGPEARAQAEYLADGMRLFRATGDFYGQGASEATTTHTHTHTESESGELITGAENATVTNSAKSTHNRYSRCPQCQGKAIQISQTYQLSEPPPPSDRKRWRSVD